MIERLLILVVVFGYPAAMFFVVRATWRWARRKGRSGPKAAALAGLSFLAFYLPPFWNHIPLVLLHRSYCNAEAGFKAYVSPEQWRSEHASDLSAWLRLPAAEREALGPRSETPDGFRRTVSRGGLLANDVRGEELVRYGVPIHKTTIRTVDLSSGVILAQAVDFRVGHREDMRAWLYRPSCVPEAKREQSPRHLIHAHRAELLKGLT